jgi:hypothetical protein
LGDEFNAIGDAWSTLIFIFKENSGDGARAVELAHPLALDIHGRESAAFEALDAANGGWPEP